MTEIKCSIIIPHYDIPELLRRCLNSIPERGDIQIIVVDDCSQCQSILESIVPELNRSNVEWYSTTEGGSAGRARNVGIDHARGEWLTFMDADDFFTPLLNDVIDSLPLHHEDVLYFHNKTVMSDDISQSSNRNIFDYHFRTYLTTGNEKPLRFEFDALWGKIVKKSLIDTYHLRFQEVRYSNDTFFSAALGVYAQKIFVSKEILYVVTQRAGSLTAAKMESLDEWYTRYNVTLTVQNFMDKNRISYHRFCFADYLLLMWGKDKRIFFKEFARLSLINKARYIYYITRSLK